MIATSFAKVYVVLQNTVFLFFLFLVILFLSVMTVILSIWFSQLLFHLKTLRYCFCRQINVLYPIQTIFRITLLLLFASSLQTQLFRLLHLLYLRILFDDFEWLGYLDIVLFRVFVLTVIEEIDVLSVNYLIIFEQILHIFDSYSKLLIISLVWAFKLTSFGILMVHFRLFLILQSILVSIYLLLSFTFLFLLIISHLHLNNRNIIPTYTLTIISF